MELVQVYNLFVDAWRLYRKYCHKLSDQESDELVNHSNRIYKKYNTDFAKKIILEVLCEVENIQKRKFEWWEEQYGKSR